jgi:hypothetical protein
VKDRLRELLSALVEEAPDACPTKSKAEAALASTRATAARLRNLLSDLAEEAPDQCPTKPEAEFFLAASPPEQAALARQGGSIARFSGDIFISVSAVPVSGEYLVSLYLPGAGENVLVPAADVAHVSDPSERYDVVAAMALARSATMRSAAAWAEGPSTRRSWRGYIVERSPSQGRRWAVVLDGDRYDAIEHPSLGLRIEREDRTAVWTGRLLPSGEFRASSSTLRAGKRDRLLELVRAGDPLGRGARRRAEPHLRGEPHATFIEDLLGRIRRQETSVSEATAELTARAFGMPVLFVVHQGPVPVKLRRRRGGHGLYGVTSKAWIAIRQDGWPVLAPGPEGSVETWPTKAAAEEALASAQRAERVRR